MAACLIAKVSVLLFDDRVRLFLGDSATYLWSAVALNVPPDSSVTDIIIPTDGPQEGL